MNRTALCIRMLALLKVRGRMRIDEIAEALETNPRNVREFRKELEIAGYPIIQTTGRYGGYQLDASALLPAPALDAQEEDALQEACRYLRSHTDFIAEEAFERAMGKILISHPLPASAHAGDQRAGTALCEPLHRGHPRLPQRDADVSHAQCRKGIYDRDPSL